MDSWYLLAASPLGKPWRTQISKPMIFGLTINHLGGLVRQNNRHMSCATSKQWADKGELGRPSPVY